MKSILVGPIGSVGVQFSGNGKGIYWYTFTTQDTGGFAVKPGTRAVVPTKMKEDGTVSLSIATVIEIKDTVDPGADKPVVGFLDPGYLAEVTEHCRQLEAAKAAA